jgi:guanine deaminase
MSTVEEQKKFMRMAIQLSVDSVENGGGPFGAVIVKDGIVISKASNRVTLDNDPTAHAEVCAIRDACHSLGTYNLNGCELYASCEPCPMCLSSMYWAHISRYYYANDKIDAKNIGFDDDFIYSELALSPEKRTMPRKQILRDKAILAFNIWMQKTDKKEY